MGTQPRTEEFFRPLLEDIRNAASQWRKKLFASRHPIRTLIVAAAISLGVLVSLWFVASTVFDPFRGLPPIERQAVMAFPKSTVYAIDPDEGIVEMQISWLPKDSEFAHFYKLPNLRQLTIVNVPVTDRDLEEHFGRLEQVKTLIFVNTRVSDNGVATLRKALPNCSVTAEQLESFR